MKAQEIRLNINELVNGIRDEAFLTACYEAVEGIAKAYRRVAEKSNGTAANKKTAAKPVQKKAAQAAPEASARVEEKSIPHDLSLVLLANEIFKGSEPLPEEGEIAFERAFRKSLKNQPTLPNRL